jgi:hypothetical protein
MFKIAVPELVSPEDHVSGDDSPNFKPIIEHRSDQEWTFRRTYFYTHGKTSEDWKNTVIMFFAEQGYKFIPSDSGKVQNNWPKESFFFVRGRFEELPQPEVLDDVISSIKVISDLQHLMTSEETEEFEMLLNWVSDDEEYDLVQKPLGDLSVKLIQRETDQAVDVIAEELGLNLDDDLVKEEVEIRYADENIYMTKEEAGRYSFLDSQGRTWILTLIGYEKEFPWLIKTSGTVIQATSKRQAMKMMLEDEIRREWSS